ncbi:MAG: hypothetical protein RBT28_11015, partial [Bacteroidales bacterium]|nr:hypothetical protein [Bacteroidales bacterium]
GISAGLLQHVTRRITIPGPPNPVAGLESLNVSMAAAIVCSEFFRRGLAGSQQSAISSQQS